jgi:hypothetical protein
LHLKLLIPSWTVSISFFKIWFIYKLNLRFLNLWIIVICKLNITNRALEWFASFMNSFGLIPSLTVFISFFRYRLFANLIYGFLNLPIPETAIPKSMDSWNYYSRIYWFLNLQIPETTIPDSDIVFEWLYSLKNSFYMFL